MKRFYSSKLLVLVAVLLGLNVNSFAQTLVSTFAFTGAPVSYTVPAGVFSLTVDMQGGKGGTPSTDASGIGGAGGRVQATLTTTPGEVLYIYVGAQGVAGGCCSGNSPHLGGYNGGGAGCGYGGGGGGASDIRTILGNLSSRLLVAAGGGGGAHNCTQEKGGVGGGYIGGDGLYCNPTVDGHGATQTAGGAGGNVFNGTAGSAGTFGVGADVYFFNTYGPGGGGGGWWGGGSGTSYGGGGGGGSSYGDTVQVANTKVFTPGYNSTGDGSVTFTANCTTPASGTISGPASVCPFLTASYTTTVPAGGSWMSTNTAVATINPSTGVVTGVSPGTTTISYSYTIICGTGTAAKVVTVSTPPLPITGAVNACVGNTTFLSDATPGGKWTSSNTTSATVGFTTGILNGLVVGTPIITYLVTSTGCFAVRTETVNALPNVYTVSGGGVMCIGGTGFHITQSGSDNGVAYQLYLAGVATGAPVAGTGSPLDFGLQTANGSYTVIATNSTSLCTQNMAGSGSVTVNPLPASYPVTVGGGGTSGSYCSGGTGVHIILGNSDIGVNYQLYIGALSVGSAISGTGSAIDFGPQTSAGTYSIVGTNTSTTCFGNMSNTVTISINPLPNIYSVTGGGSYCALGAGVAVGLSGSDVGVNYQLLLAGIPSGSFVAGTGSAITFGARSGAGIYTVVGNNPLTSCTQNMSGSVSIAINPLPTAYPFTATSGGAYCPGGTGKDISLSFSNVGISYQLLNGGVPVPGALLAGTGSLLDFGIFTTPGTYTIVGTNTTTLCTNLMSGNVTISISALPTKYLVVVPGGVPSNYCAGGTGVPVGLSFSDVGVNYQLYNGIVPVPGGLVAGTGAAISFGLQTSGGTYTVIGTSTITGCTNNMNGSVLITVNPLPTPYIVGGGGGYCAGSTPPHVTISGSDIGTTYQLYRGGVATGLSKAGTGSLIDFGAQPIIGTYTVGAVTTVTGCAGNMTGSVIVSINPLPIASPVTGGGNYCAGGTGEHVGVLFSSTGISYQLYKGGIALGGAVLGVGGPLDFGLQTGTGVYTVIGTNTITGCSNNMTGSVTVGTIPLPTPYTVTGGGAYCAGTAGPHVGLSASNVGINYQLYNGSLPVGGTVLGTGLVLDFGAQPVAGVYTVVATNATTGCTNNMTGSVNINVTPLPNVYTVTGGGNYCPGGSGLNVGLSMSDVGVNYQLYKGGVMVGVAMNGTGSPLDFGIKTAPGTYTVIAINAVAGCTSNMSGSAIIGINPPPTAYTITGGGAYCASGAGEHIYLSGSDVGNTYQLFSGGLMVGTSMTGTGASIDFGPFFVGGTYTAVATNSTTGCTSNMTSGAIITVNPAPNVFNVTGGGPYCSGGTGVAIGLSSSNLGISYQLYNGGVAVGFVAPGTGSPINFGLHATAGTYTAIATNPATGCVADMALSATVTVTPLVTPGVSLSGLGYTCAGTPTSFTATPSNGGSAPTYQWSVNGTAIAGATDATFSDTSANFDNVKVTMTSNASCPVPSTVSTSEVVTIHATGTPSVAIAETPGPSVCQGTSVTFGVSLPIFEGTSPKYVWTRSGIPQDSGLSYTYVPANNDVVVLTMTSNDPCALTGTATNSVTMAVQGPAAAPVFSLVSKMGPAISLGEADTIIATVTPVAGVTFTYQWVLNGSPIPGANSPVFVSNNFFNKDSIACIVTSEGTCGGTSAGKGISLTVRNTTGVTTVGLGSDIRVMPNPNKGVFTVKGTLSTSTDEEVSLEIVNMVGQVVYKNKVMAIGGNINEQVKLNNTLANGMYLLSVRTENENSVFHFVIEQ